MRILFKGSQHNFYLTTVQTTTDCNRLQHVATHCNTVRLHYTATYRTQTAIDLIHKHKRAVYTLKRSSHTPNITAYKNQYTQSNEPSTNILICTRKNITKHKHARARAHTHTHAHTCTRARAHTYTHAHTHMYIHAHTFTHTHKCLARRSHQSPNHQCVCVRARQRCVCVCVCARVCVCVCVCECVCVYYTDTRQ